MRFYLGMPKRQRLKERGPRLSTLGGLQEAGIAEGIAFDPFKGVAHVVYTQDWLVILRANFWPFDDQFLMAAIQIDDPVAVRSQVERVAGNLRKEAVASDERGPRSGSNGPPEAS